jgi:hypothetical protein
MEKTETFSIAAYQDPDWMRYIDNHPDSHLFHHPAWLTFLAACYGYIPYVALVRNHEGEVTAGLPFMEISHFNTRRWVSLPFSDYCPPLYSSKEALHKLENGIINETLKRNISELELRWDYSSSGLYQSTDHVLTTTRLFTDSDLVLDNIKGNDFRKVKLGLKRGIEIEKSTSMEAMKIFYKLHVETRRRLGVPVQPWRFFQLLSEQIIQPGMGFISLARHEGEYLAGIVFLKWKSTLIYKFSASSQKGRQLAASYPVTWDAICWGCENHYSLFDWGRSDIGDDGLRDFKNRWASKEKPLVYSRNRKDGASLLEKAKPLVQSMLSRAPAWVCRLSGEILYRYFG